MSWYAYLLASAALFLAGAAIALFLPLRIFICYLRKNRKDQVSVAIRLSCCGLRIGYTRAGELNRLSWQLIVGTRHFTLPGEEKASRLLVRLFTRGRRRLSRRAKFDWGFVFRKSWEAFQEIKAELKRISWKYFDLEVSFGLANPALAGLAAGCGWAGAGVMLGLMQRFFSFETRPRVKIVPHFCGGELQVHWRSEFSLPLYRWLKIVFKTRKKMLEVF